MKLVIRQERIRHGWTQEYATKKLGIRLLLLLLFKESKRQSEISLMMLLSNCKIYSKWETRTLQSSNWG